MLSLITTLTHIPKSHHQPFARLKSPLIHSPIVEYNPKKKANKYRNSAFLSRCFGFTEVRRAWSFEMNLDSSWLCWCKLSEGEGEGDVELEAEIMDFMAKSEKPTMFPTKKELMRAGRMDLVEAIKKRGGWYSLGWDDENVGDNVDETMDFDVGEFQRRVESCKESASLREHHGDSFSGDDKENGVSSELNLSSGNLDSLQLTAPASPGRSREIGADEDSGIEGILSRLEKQRNSDIGIDFEINFGKNGYEAHARSADEGDGRELDTSLGVARTDLEGNGRLTPGFHQKGILSNSGDNISRNSEPENWRTWSDQRAGSQLTAFEAAEISLSKDQVETDKESHHDGIFVSTEEDAEAWYKYEKINHNEIRTRLQHLECELTTALRSLRSKREECISEEATGSSSDLQKLSDAWEFQENEFMSAQERLRSIKAKLAVLEGKMSLALINAQKIVETKQKQIDGAHKALQLLRTTCIVWPNSASEVLLAGSFDGWTTQRKMEKSKTGIFSVSLMLYPGRYEIKFIVDGTWKVDPLRPIVKNNGYENNLFIVS